jgi:hypothetical protein
MRLMIVCRVPPWTIRNVNPEQSSQESCKCRTSATKPLSYVGDFNRGASEAEDVLPPSPGG